MALYHGSLSGHSIMTLYYDTLLRHPITTFYHDIHSIPFYFRPSFDVLERWLGNISLHFVVSSSLTIPQELMNEITSFTGYHMSSSSSNESSPETRRAPLLRTISELAGDASDV